MIQDLGNHRLDNAFCQLEAGPDSLVLCCDCRGMRVLAQLVGEKVEDNSGIPVGGDLALPRLRDLAAAGAEPEGMGLTYLLSVDDVPLFLARTAGAAAAVPAGFAWESLRDLRMARPRWLAFAAATGFHLAGWYRSNRFCGCCGHPTQLVPTSREIACPNCGNVIYPRINPGVIVGVLDSSHQRLLLTKYSAAHYRYANYALVAGFTEIGETMEQTVVREVAEEVGLAVGRVTYWGDQPWPFSSSLLAAYWCEVQGSCELTVDHGELKSAVWLTREQIPMPRRDTSSITNAMISAFAEGFDPYA